MPDIIDAINLMTAISGLTISILGLFLCLRFRNMDKTTTRFFLLVFSILTIYIISDLVSQVSLVIGGLGNASLTKAAIFSESFFSSLLMPLLTLYLLHRCGQTIKTGLFYIVSILWTVYFVLLVITQFTTIIYYITADNRYSRGPWYPVLLVPTVLLMICNMVGLYKRKELLSAKEQKAFWAYLVIPAISMVLQMCSYSLLFIVFGTGISALIMFLYITEDQISRTITQAIEINEQQLRIRTLQMRPHFIYNTMTNIYYLCEQDPKKAQRVVGDFTTYLRNNFSAVAAQGLIPFSDELEHTKAYLAVVEARYESMLFVEYDIAYYSFHMPPLTLEPIVENAVKHGLDPESSPLNIWIRTEKSENCVTITVENSGTNLMPPGEKPEEDVNSEPHIGLSNVSDRLNTLCGGTLSMTPREGGGVIVVLNIPLLQQD